MKNLLGRILVVILVSNVLFTVYGQNDTITNKSLSEDLIKNLKGEGFEEGMTINWSINYDDFNYLKENNYKLVIEYNTDVRAKKHKDGYSNSMHRILYTFSKSPFLGFYLVKLYF